MNDTDNSCFLPIGEKTLDANTEGVPNRNYKDTVFRLLFQDRVKLPTPHFVVFYNGTDKQPEMRKMCLSDAYEVQKEEKELELSVTVLNINKGYNEALKEKCPALKDYAEYVEKVRQHTRECPLKEAVELAVSECIKEGILKDFLLENRAEVVSMSIFEYNQEEQMKMERQEAYSAGCEEGRAKGREEGAALKLCSLVQTWMGRGIKEEEITDLAGEPREDIFRLIRIIRENSQADGEQILEQWEAVGNPRQKSNSTENSD